MATQPQPVLTKADILSYVQAVLDDLPATGQVAMQNWLNDRAQEGKMAAANHLVIKYSNATTALDLDYGNAP